MPEVYFKKTVFSFGRNGLIIFLATLNAFVPLSTDLYLPALPHMTEVFDTSESIAKLTLSLFMLFFALSMLVWGPVSDRLGRKKILSAGLLVYIAASILCAKSTTVELLIWGRILQATGCGAISSVSMAIVKDTFKGRIMETVLVWIQTMTVLCPMIAPLLGAFLLQFTSWRGLFYIFVLAGCVALGLSLALKETLHQKSETPVWFFASRIVFVLRNKGFRSLLLLFSLTAMPFMAYLATSSFIYAAMFKTSTEVYSYFFAVNAFSMMLGPLAYIRFLRHMPCVPFIAVCLSVTTLCGAVLLFWGSDGPFIFAAIFLPITFLGAAIRPVGTVLMMSQLNSDNGAVASLIGSSALLFGSLSMLITSLPWVNPIIALGAVCFGSGGISFLLWLVINHKPKYQPILPK